MISNSEKYCMNKTWELIIVNEINGLTIVYWSFQRQQAWEHGSQDDSVFAKLGSFRLLSKHKKKQPLSNSHEVSIVDLLTDDLPRALYFLWITIYVPIQKLLL